MSLALNALLTETSVKISQIRLNLHFASSERIDNLPNIRDRGALTTASSYIWMCAAFEFYTKEFMAIIVREINNSGIKYKELAPCLYSLAFSSELQSLQDVRGLKMWIHRVNLFIDLHKNDPVFLNENDLPVDGKTIRPDHIDAIWKVFQFDLPNLPHPRHKLALIDLAEGRNEVAHGETDPIRFGRSRNVDDTIKILDMVDEIIVHMSICGENYLNDRKYKI